MIQTMLRETSQTNFVNTCSKVSVQLQMGLRWQHVNKQLKDFAM